MSIEEKATTAIDQTLAQPNEAAVSAALAVLDRFMAALNGGDETALLATLHFPPLPARREQDAAVGSARNLPWRLLRPRRPGLAPQWMGFSQGYRRRRRQGALGRAIHPLSRRQLGLAPFARCGSSPRTADAGAVAARSSFAD